jgi:hypothetical protein
MISSEAVHIAAFFGGIFVAAGAVLKPSPDVIQMIEKIDPAVLEKMSAIAGSATFDEAIWRSVRLWHIIRQGCLMTRITVKIARLYPDQFDGIPEEQRRVLVELLRSAMLSAICRVNARACAEQLIRLFAVTEQAIVTFDQQSRAFSR